MPYKLDPDRDHGQKVIELFFRLFFSPYEYSMSELARDLGCSKQTVGRIVDKINRSLEGIKIEDVIRNKRRFFRIRKDTVSSKAIHLSRVEYGILQMCCAFTKNLIGPKVFEQAVTALGKSQVLIAEGETISTKHFGAFAPGTIDYTNHRGIIKDLIIAMETRKVCKLRYRSIWNQAPKVFYIKPLKLFSKGDTIYLHAQMAKAPGKIYKTPDFDPLLAVHRMEALEITPASYKFPDDFDFEKAFNQTFGVMKEEAFQLKVAFSGYAARYIRERIWSHDQALVVTAEDQIELTLTATSPLEALTWILSHGDQARVLEPAWFASQVKETARNIINFYP